MSLSKSWVNSANNPQTEFPLNNLPYGVFSVDNESPRCGVAIGDRILDVCAIERAGLLDSLPARFCQEAGWNTLMAQNRNIWKLFRSRISELLAIGAEQRSEVEPHLHAVSEATMHLPFTVAEYTDFYSGRHHATNVGTMFRGAQNALPPNWLHIPIGYNGRASSVVVSGTDIRRPWGQLKPAHLEVPEFGPSRRFDLELEMGAIVGTAAQGPFTVDEANAMIFGYVLLNDWSARDIQAWEYQPLGPFQAKATATTISPWIVTSMALEAFRVPLPQPEVPLLPYLLSKHDALYNVDLEITLAPINKAATTISRTNYREMYFSAAQQLTHHASSGCPMRTGDLLGSGTISGPEKNQRGSLLELSWGGKEAITLGSGETRTFLEDGDTLTLLGRACGDGYRIGFGECTGKLLPALQRN